MRGRRCITLMALIKPTSFSMICMQKEKRSGVLNLIDSPPNLVDATGTREAIHD